MDQEEERVRLLGRLGGSVVSLFPRLQVEVTLPQSDLVHVTPAEADVLRAVVLDPGSTVGQIATSIGQYRSNTSMRIANLVEKDLVEKRSEAEDGREVLVYPTVKAAQNLAGFQSVWGRILADVSSADVEGLRIPDGVFRG